MAILLTVTVVLIWSRVCYLWGRVRGREQARVECEHAMEDFFDRYVKDGETKWEGLDPGQGAVGR